MKIFVTYILNWIWHDLSVTVDIMSLQFGHDVLQHFLPTMDRFSQKEKQVLLRHNCERHKSSISYSRQRRGRCWQTSIFFVFFEIWLCDVLERPTVQENRCCWYFVVQAPMDKSSVTKYKNENNCVLCDNCYNPVSIANFRYSHIHLCFKFFDPFLTLYVYPGLESVFANTFNIWYLMDELVTLNKT